MVEVKVGHAGEKRLCLCKLLVFETMRQGFKPSWNMLKPVLRFCWGAVVG